MKTNNLVKKILVIALLSVSALAVFQAFAAPAFADGPVIKEEVWEDHIWRYSPHDKKQDRFVAPAKATSVEIIAEWGWSGKPGQRQTNEEHEVRWENGKIHCKDFGDHELAGQWVHCGSTSFEWDKDLDVDVVFTGDDSSPGSHDFKVIVRWLPIPPPPPKCDWVTADLNPETMEVTGNGTGQGVAWRVIDLDHGDQVMDNGSGNQANFTFSGAHEVTYQLQFQGTTGEWTTEGCTFSSPKPPVCYENALTYAINPETMEVTGSGSGQGVAWQVADQSNGQVMASGSGNQANFAFSGAYEVTYQLQFQSETGKWSSEDCPFTFYPPQTVTCQIEKSKIGDGYKVNKLWAEYEDGPEVPTIDRRARSNFGFPSVDALTSLADGEFPMMVDFPDQPGQKYWVQFEVAVDKAALQQASALSSEEIWIGGESCRLEYELEDTCRDCGQYQDFVGAVAFGTYTPYLEPGKEYFDGTRSVMVNVEYLDGAGQGDVVFRFNGQEVSDVTASIFNADTFRQVETTTGRAVIALESGVTKLIAYRYGVEQARIFQSFSNPANRWIHPLDQPFEHKYGFVLELHGPANTTDLLVYGDQVSEVSYAKTGIANVNLTYTEPGLVAVYNTADNTNEVDWTTVELVTYSISRQQTVSYDFAESGLYHYRLVDTAGQLIAGPTSTTHLEFKAEPGMTYSAQLAYPVTSLFVGLYDDMKFEHPDYWTMPIDGRLEHDFEFHLDYHRLSDPDLGNDHIRGDVVVDGLTLSYGTTSVAQQFPYGRHDGARAGVNIVGIPNVSMIAFCQRPGYHEVVYWGGWENESYYLPDRGWVFDEEMADEWNEDQRGECIDTARRVNMELARQGLRTDHTFRHHGERSQGYQMVQQHIWSPYNLVEMRPPHLGQIFKPGKVLAYYEDPEEILFWGWDLDKGGLADGLGAYELQKHVASLGPAQYVDMTGIHPPEDVYVPEPPTVQAVLEPAAPAPSPAPPKLTPEEPMPEPTPEPTPEPPASEPETPDDLIPQPPRLAPEPTPTT